MFDYFSSHSTQRFFLLANVVLKQMSLGVQLPSAGSCLVEGKNKLAYTFLNQCCNCHTANVDFLIVYGVSITDCFRSISLLPEKNIVSSISKCFLIVILTSDFSFSSISFSSRDDEHYQILLHL